MSKIVYVLNETEENGGETTLGVFDSPDIGDDKLREYYGRDAVVLGCIDIRDSGLEWQKRVSHVDGVAVVTLHCFKIGEL